MDERAEIFKKADLFAGLDDEAVSYLASRAKEKKLAKDEILFIAGEPSSGLFVIAEGSVRAFRSSPDGREQVIHIERAVTTVAEVTVFDEGSYPSTVAAEEPTRVFFLPKLDIREACIRHPQLALTAAKLLALRLRKCAELVETLSLREVGQRVARVLLEQATAKGVKDGSAAFQQPLTHNQLAARIGTVREVVTRSFIRLQTLGLVEINGKKVNIPDIAALAKYAASAQFP